MLQKRFLTLFFLSGLLIQFMWGQTREVTGTVISGSDGYPIIGANVRVQDTTTGTITDLEGNFSIQATPNAVLEISYIGYGTQSVSLNGRTHINVTMQEDSKMLEQVVVTGYTTQRRADLTGAISVVSMDEILKTPENNPIKALQGRVPGMQITGDGNPGGKVNIKIRGISNLADNSTPLYVIDGIPTQSGMHELNPNDIESIQVLKDAASASIYGSRAANGVIVITTKQGKEGKMSVNFDASVTSSWYHNRTEMLNTKEYGQAMWQAIVNKGMDPNMVNSIGYLYDWNYNADGQPVLNGMKVPKYIDKAGRMPASDTDWFDEVSRTGIAQNYNLSVSGGSEKFSSQFSLNYYDNQGTLKDTYFNRISARMNSRYKLWDDIIVIGENFSINRTKEVEANTEDILNQALQSHPLIPVRMTDGNWGGPSSGMNDRHNPVRILDANKDNPYTYWRLFGNAYIDIQPIKDLHVKSSFGIDYGNFYKRMLTRSFISGEMWDEDLTAVELQQRHWMRWTWSNTATYNVELGKHRLDFLGGIEMNKHEDIEFATYREGFELETPDYMWPDAGSGDAMSYGGSSEFALMSYFGKINYVYDNRYLFSATVRHDGSSRFGKNNRFATFPSFSAGWRISEESFMESTRTFLSDLKLRVAWGQTGNQNTISNTAIFAIYGADYGGSGNDGGGSTGTAYDIYGRGTGLLPSGFRKMLSGNDNLKWETSTQTNIGLDFGFFGQNLYGSFDYYIKETKDLLAMVYYAAAAGEGSGHWANGASMENKGFEFLLGYRGQTSFGLTYDITGNISGNRNKITKLPESLINTYGGNGADDNILGRSIYSHYGYVADGIFRTQEEVDNHADQSGKGLGRIRYKNLNNDNIIDADDRTWIGSAEPDFEYGINIALGYKNFDLSAFFQGIQGGEVFNDLKKHTDFWSVQQTGSNKGRRLLNAWSPTNTGSSIPALSYTDDNWEDRPSTYFLESQSYLKLRNLQIGYTLPTNVSQRIRMEKVRIYVSGQNLFTIKSKGYTGVDPENPGWGYPIPLTASFGLNVTF